MREPERDAAPASGVLRLDDFAALRVSGEDRVDFLQGQLSQDLGGITPSQAAPAAWCNRQGRVLCLMVVIEWDGATYLILPADMAETCLGGLGRYILRARVRMERWDGVSAGKGGTAARDMPLLPGVFGCAGIKGLGAEVWSCRVGEAYCAVRLPGEDPRALLLGEPPPATAAAFDMAWTQERWRLADIRSALPWIGPATSGRFLAHSLNLDLSGAVSFDKGCYVGQEIIARMEYRGTPKRRMQRVRLPLDAGAEPGARIERPDLGRIMVIASARAGDHVEALAEVRVSPAQADREDGQ